MLQKLILSIKFIDGVRLTQLIKVTTIMINIYLDLRTNYFLV